MTKKATHETTFEAALERLEAIIEQLESEAIGLDESVELFNEGRELVNRCREDLAEAEERVRTLLRDEDGNLAEQAGLSSPDEKE